MDKSDIILWVISGGFSLMLLMWHSLNTRIEKIEERSNRDFEKFSKNFEEIDGQLHKINNRLDKIEERSNRDFEKFSKNFENSISEIQIINKDLQQINTRLAVLESKVNDVNNNVTHLMWHNQAYPYREVKEE